MARTWLSMEVELVGGRGEDLWPYPCRVLAVGPQHTFADLAAAIDLAFARWDRAHLCQFTLADGTVVTDEETGEELLGSPFGPVARAPLVLGRAKVSDVVKPGDEFSYVFDFGDDWTHACTVETAKVDPREVLGVVPKVPTPTFGWGSIPDQNGRRWDGDAPGEAVPRRPDGPHPMYGGGWPTAAIPDPVDLTELRGATYRRDVPAILAAIEGRDLGDVLQQVGMGVQVVLTEDRRRGEALAVSLLGRLDDRCQVGDDILAEDLLAQLQGTPLMTRHLPVDLSDLGSALSGDPLEEAGCLDLQSGEIISAVLLDPAYVDEDDVVDVESEPDRWLWLERRDGREQWNDMAEFVARQRNADLRRRLEAAIEGKGAFRRFRRALDGEDLVGPWRRFSGDREIGRARAYLAERGIRVAPPS
jgi:hypothetical protein